MNPTLYIIKNNNILSDKDFSMLKHMKSSEKYTSKFSISCIKQAYWCNKAVKSRGFNLLHKLIFLAPKYPNLYDIIKNYLQLYPEEINKTNEKEWYALQLAVTQDNENSLKITKLLLKNNADIHHRNLEGENSLMIAAQTASLKIIKLLLKNNANVLSRDNEGWTTLFHAIFYGSDNEGYIEVIKLLLKYDGIVNMIDWYIGETALTRVSKYPNLDAKIVQLLLENGANNKETALHNALNYSNNSVAKILLEYDANSRLNYDPEDEDLFDIMVKDITILNTKN